MVGTPSQAFLTRLAWSSWGLILSPEETLIQDMIQEGTLLVSP